MLDYPVIANAFRKSNATLPSSAAVERLFSAAAQVLTSRMTDDTLDRLLLLRCVRKLGTKCKLSLNYKEISKTIDN